MKKSILCSLIISLLLCSYHFAEGAKKKKSGNYPDLTKGEKWEKPKAKGGNGQFGRYMLGPTGLMSFMIGGETGSQILIDMSIVAGKLLSCLILQLLENLKWAILFWVSMENASNRAKICVK